MSSLGLNGIILISLLCFDDNLPFWGMKLTFLIYQSKTAFLFRIKYLRTVKSGLI